MMEKLTFDKLPQAIEVILDKLGAIEQLLSGKNEEQQEHKEIMDVEEAGHFLKLTRSTIYTKVSRGELPAFKSGKRLLFNKSELMEHMQLHKKMSSYQIQKEVDLRIRHLPKTRKYTY